MPPKQKNNKGKEEKVVKLTAQELIAQNTLIKARRLFKEHDAQRAIVESLHKAKYDHATLDSAVEAERLKHEASQYEELTNTIRDDEQLEYKEFAKHEEWKCVPEASRLPNISSESAINNFLSEWREYIEEIDHSVQHSYVIARNSETPDGSYNMRFMRPEQNISHDKRQHIVDELLNHCVEAFEVVRLMIEQRNLEYFHAESKQLKFIDTSRQSKEVKWKQSKFTKMELHERRNEELRRVCEQILTSLDFITIQSLYYYDILLTSGEGEMLMRSTPEREPIIKYGLWVKVKDITRSFNTLSFPQIDIRLDPKLNAPPRLPKSMGLSRENVAVRVMQLSFDPYAGYDLSTKEFYPLNCTLKVDLITFNNRPQKVGDWLLRSETEQSHVLHCEEYPPLNLESRNDDPAFRISFNVPSTIVLRQPTLLIGKWTSSLCEWEPCSHATFNAMFTGSSRVEAAPRRATFIANELAHFAILQEKVFDAPFSEWHIIPISYNKVIFSLEGKRRNDSTDRPIVMLVEDAYCKLLAPDYPELEQLREKWHTPCAFFHALSEAGFNFILNDSDARFLDNVLPKSKELECKVYSDMALFCQYYVIAHTRHNKGGEDANMTLFRISKNVLRMPDWVVHDDRDDNDDFVSSVNNDRYNRMNKLQFQENNNVDVNYGHYMEEHGSDDAS